jgi:hypothetical protein
LALVKIHWNRVSNLLILEKVERFTFPKLFNPEFVLIFEILGVDLGKYFIMCLDDSFSGITIF